MNISFYSQKLNILNLNYPKIQNKQTNHLAFNGKEKCINTLASTALAGCMTGYALISNNLNNDKKDISLNHCLKSKTLGNFDNYKTNVIHYFEKNNFQQYDREGEDIIKELKKANAEDSLNFELEMYLSRIINEMMNKERDMLANNQYDETKRQNLHIELEQKTGNVMVSVLKLLHKKITAPDVIKIQKDFDTKYGQGLLYLNDDLESAKACEEIFKLMEENKIPHKQIHCIILSDYLDFGGTCLDTDAGKAVFVNPNDWQVDDKFHTILHEILHTLQPSDINFNLQKIPDELKETADNVSEYSRDNFAHEVHCELYVKKLRQGLNANEEKLFNYLGGTFL